MILDEVSSGDVRAAAKALHAMNQDFSAFFLQCVVNVVCSVLEKLFQVASLAVCDCQAEKPEAVGRVECLISVEVTKALSLAAVEYMGEVCCFQVLCTFRRPCLRHPNVLPDLWCKPKRQSKTRRKKCHFASNKTTKQTNKTKTILSSQRKGDQSGLDHIAQGSVDRRPTSSLLLLGIKTAAPPDSISCSSSTVVVMVVVVVG